MRININEMSIDWEGLLKQIDSFNESGAGKIAPAAITATAPLITKGNSTTLGNIGMGIGGAVALANPAIGAAIMAASALGNAAFGSNVNEQAIDAYNDKIIDYSRPELNAKDNATLLSQLSNLEGLTINKKDLGTQGWFSHKIDDKYKGLMGSLAAANASRAKAIDNAITNVNKWNKARVEANYYPFGGPMFDYMPFGDGPIGYSLLRDRLVADYNKQLAKNNSSEAIINTLAQGGNLYNTNFDMGLSFINAGGTHEGNPYGGVFMGMGPGGTPNFVEEGEAIFNDYVFSNRLRVPKAVRNKYKLRETSFADAVREYFRKNGLNERENDPIAHNGLMAFAEELMQHQELLRAKKNMKNGNMFPDGGYIPYDRKYSDYDSLYAADSDYMKAVNWYKDPAHSNELRDLITSIRKGDYGSINGYPLDENNWYGLATDHKKGPVHNAMLAKMNELVNAITENDVPITASPDDVAETTMSPTKLKSRAEAAAILNGKLPKGPLDKAPTGITAPVGMAADRAIALAEGEKKNKEVRAEYLANVYNGANGYRLAGLFANAAGLAYNLLDPYKPAVIDEVKPFQPIAPTPIGDYVPEKHFDVNYAANQQAQQAAATRSAIMNATSPSRFATLLAADYNAQVANGDLRRKAAMDDYDNLLKARAFNRETNKFNSQMDFEAARANMSGRQANDMARLHQAQYNISNYDSYKRGRDAAIGQGTTALADWLTDYGKEGTNLAMIGALRNAGVLHSNEDMDMLFSVLGNNMLSGRKRKIKR